MWRSFRLKLVITMIVFAAVVAFTIAIINHLRIVDQAVQDIEFQVEKIETTVAYSLNTIDKMYFYFDQETAEEMRLNTMILQNLYAENPDFDTWDMERLKEEFGMDIYILNEDNLITHSSKADDIGLDFEACCGKLARILDETRASGEFSHDGMDIDQSSGEVKKFSYMATPDKKHIIELSYSLEDGQIFKDFNFLRVIRDLEESYPSINTIKILNIGGLALGSKASESQLTPAQREAFENTLHHQETTELRTKEDGETVIYRYVPYDAVYDAGSTQNKVIEIAYNEDELKDNITRHRQIFILQLIFILFITVIIALIISGWVSRPMYMAFHDSLTGLRNRAAFEEDLKEALKEGNTGLIMVDLDNFKLVNDEFGHSEGDELLKQMARNIQAAISKGKKAYRLGGDEFAVVLEDTTMEAAKETAEDILKKLNENVVSTGNYRGIEMTASIGIAMSDKDIADITELYKKADKALYESKEDGKNQYRVFD